MGCIETYIAGPGLSRLAKHLTGLEKTPPKIAAELEGKLKGLSGAPAKATATPAPTGVHGAAADALVRPSSRP